MHLKENVVAAETSDGPVVRIYLICPPENGDAPNGYFETR